MSLIDISVKRPVGTIMFFIGVILLGFISLSKLSINLLPNLSYPKISILTEYPGSGPEEVEKFITTKLEGPVNSITGVKKINSISKEGISIITLEFHWGTDMDFALLHTKEKTEEARKDLPDDCPAPIILEWDPSASPIIIAIMKSRTRNLKNIKDSAEFIIKPRLEQLQGISRVEIRGGDEEEISVEIDPEKIKNIGITLNEVINAIESNNIFQSGGTVKKDKFRYTLKIEGEINTPEEIENIVVRRLGGRNVLIKDIGNAFFKNKIKQGDIRFNLSPSIALLIYRESSGNTVKATEDTRKAFSEMQKEFDDLEFSIISMEAELIVSSIRSLTQSLLIGGFFAFFILLLFLQNFQGPIYGAISIIISVVSTFVLMFLVKVNVNIMSLGGLVLGVGMFVDNSIIVIESIFRHRSKENIIDSVINGTKEVSGAITASTLTTVSIFLPVIYLYGITGKLFRDQALTVSFSLISSLLVAVTLLPALAAFRSIFKTDFLDDMNPIGKGKWVELAFRGFHSILLIPLRVLGYIIYFILAAAVLAVYYPFKYMGKLINLILKPIFRWFNKLYNQFDKEYHRILEKILDKKIIALFLSLSILILIFLSFFLLKKELLPSPDSRKFEIKASTIPSYGFEETNRIARRIEKKIKNLEGVDFIFTEAGAVSKFAARSEEFSVNSIHLIVKCTTPKKRPDIMARTRDILATEKINLLNFSVYLEKNTLSQYLSVGEENFQIKVFYDNIESGKQAANLIMEHIKDMKALKDLDVNTAEGKPLFVVSFKQELLNKLNITKQQIASFVNQAVRGENAGVLRKIQKNYDIIVRVPVKGIIAINRLLSLPIPINGESYFLRDLIEFKAIPSIKEINRESQERYFLISADVKAGLLDKIIKNTEKKLEKIDFPVNTRYVFAGEEEEKRKAFDSLNQAILLAIILVYMVMAAKFENIVQPIIIMFTVPMGIIGAFLFLLLSGNSLNIISGIGIMVLIGIGVNDAIVKVEYSNQLRSQGITVRDAVMTASRVRLQPILMTSFTTIFGLIPMAVMTQTGSELQRPLALVVIGGLLFTTFLTLILIPVFYEGLENLKSKRQLRKKSKLQQEK
jgi:HAE1 family hydrophobic/amphiphilic exporter-1